MEVGVEGVLCLFVSISSCLSSAVSKFCELLLVFYSRFVNRHYRKVISARQGHTLMELAGRGVVSDQDVLCWYA